MASTSYPDLISAPRITTLLASLVVSVASGTNYVFSAWAPQLGTRLNISHTKLNIIALGGNAGVYTSGPIWGRIADSRGPSILLAGAFVFLLVGYSGIRHFYDAGLAATETTLSTPAFLMLVIFSILTGAGGNGGHTGSVNATAKSFPDRARGSTTGFVISGFGLSAFLFSTIAHLAYPGDTSSLLFILAFGTAFPMVIGFFLVRPIPLPPSESHGHEDAAHGGDAEAIGAAAVIFQHENDSEARLLDEDDLSGARSRSDAIYEGGRSVELSRSLSPNSGRRGSRSSFGRSLSRLRSSAHTELESLPNIHGSRLWAHADFWLLFSMLSMLSGTGLMYINNVGSMSQALYAKANSPYDPLKAGEWQATQVSMISLNNFAGRIIIGLISDFAKTRLHVPRSYCLVIVSCTLLASQLYAASVEEVTSLWKASMILGLGYGSVFSMFPSMCIEWFGLPHFSENWGFLSMAPLVAGNLFSVAFGRNLDAHTPTEAPPKASLSRASPNTGTEPIRQCMDGRACYVSTLHLTTAACALCVGLSVWAGWRDRRKAMLEARRKEGEVEWDREPGE
ncbi:hypothetical protein HGRIS_009059 [Hohenbuehelia grisea]|uniref:MFS general substrate transporter n=1 Tax=Hohenbuehelia grisea TaxID=104357 RepID=A0ABR3J035_9AGAR